MKIVSDALAAIAVTLDCDYIRSMNLTEADNDVHNLESIRNLIVYDGPSAIATEFEGAMIIDVMECEIYFLTKMTSKDMTGLDVDDLLQITKGLADAAYAILNKEPHAKDIEPYGAEAMQVFTDMYIGHKVTIGLPFYNTGCGTKTIKYDFADGVQGFTDEGNGDSAWAFTDGVLWQSLVIAATGDKSNVLGKNQVGAFTADIKIEGFASVSGSNVTNASLEILDQLGAVLSSHTFPDQAEIQGSVFYSVTFPQVAINENLNIRIANVVDAGSIFIPQITKITITYFSL